MNRYSTLAIALSLLPGLAAPARAQSATKSKYLIVYTYHVKPEANTGFADFLKNKWMPAMKKGGASPRIYSSTPVGGDPAVWVITNPVDSLANFDNPITSLEKGAGAKAYTAMQAQRAGMIESRMNTILTRQTDMSVYSDSPSDSPLLLIAYIKTVPGKQGEFRNLWMKDLVPAVKKAGHQMSVWRVAFGEETQFVVTRGLSSFAELEKGFTAAQLAMDPQAYTTWNAAVGQTAASIRREVLRLRPDLMDAK